MPSHRPGQPAQPAPQTQKLKRARIEIAEVLEQAFGPHRIGSDKVKFNDPQAIMAAIDVVLEKYFSPPASELADLSTTGDTIADRFEHVALSTHPITRRRIKNMRTRVKRLWFWKPRHMAEFLNISRPHLENIIAGRKDWDAEFERRFRLLERRIVAWTYENKERSREMLNVKARRRLPNTFEILAKPIQCRKCKRWIIPKTPNQKYCPNHKP